MNNTQRLESRRIVSNTVRAVTLLAFIALLGIMGYQLIEGYTFEQALYMTFITMSTVGFTEVKPLSPAGHYFTVFLILASIGLFAYVLGVMVRFMVDGGFRDYYFNRKLYRRIKRMEGHVILIGYGRNGKQAAIELEEHNTPFIIIENSDDAIHRMREDGITSYVQGDATLDDILERAGIYKASALITCLPNDADNTFVVISARSMNPVLKIISRASEDHADLKIKRAGADNVIMPERIGGIRMAKLVAQPDVVEFMENILMQSEKKVMLEEIDGKDVRECYMRGSVHDLHEKTKSGVTIIGIKRADGEYLFNPSREFVIDCDDKLFVLGAPAQISKLKRMIHHTED